jgi:SAM-dependent methyltransferase
MKPSIKIITRKLKGIRYIPSHLSSTIRRKWMFKVYKNDPSLKGALHPNDGMFCGNVKQYIQVGEDVVRLVEQSLQLAKRDWSDLNAVLDIPSGYGRELRAFVDKVPAEKITACDILQEQIDFCGRAFGCKTFLSSDDFSSIRFPEKYSLIWVGSLFTHLDKKRFEDLLSLLFYALEPGGILIFTTHGAHSIDIFESYWRKGSAPMTRQQAEIKASENGGFYFFPYNYDPSFGVSISLKCYVESLCQRIFNNQAKIIKYEFKGWDHHQDVFAIKKLNS